MFTKPLLTEKVWHSALVGVLDTLKAKGANLIALDQNIDTSNDDPMNTAMVQLLGMFAEMERNFIVTRTTEGKIASGNYGGRKPKLTPEQRKEIKQRLAGGENKTQLAKRYNVSRATILNIEKSDEQLSLI